MPTNELEAALCEPDNDASQSRLYNLVSSISGDAIYSKSTFLKYLHAFCSSSSLVRRRWSGIALTKMMDGSADVVNYLKALLNELPRLGQIILAPHELEQTKIMAGLVICKGIEHGISFETFWPSDKVANSAINFPKESDPHWMERFQNFLDALGELSIVEPAGDPAILYAIALTASDGFRWMDSDDGVATVLIQDDHMTVIASDSILQDFVFVDVSIHRITNLRCQQSKLHDSQARRTEHEPWDLVLELRSGPPTYKVDSLGRSGDEVTLLFRNKMDAEECGNCIRELQKKADRDTKTSVPQYRMSTGDPIDVSRRPSPDKIGGVKSLQLSGPTNPNGIPNTSQPIPQKPQQTKSSQKSQQSKSSQELRRVGHLRAQNHDNERVIISTTISGSAGKGKLPKVIQSLRGSSETQSQPQPDVYTIPDEQDTRRGGNASGSSTQSKKSKAIRSNGKATRPRRKAYENDDEEYVPQKSEPRKKPSSKRKADLGNTSSEEQPKKKRKASQTAKAESSKIVSKNGQSKDTSLIGTLKNSQQSSKNTVAPPHKPKSKPEPKPTPHVVRSPSTPDSERKRILSPKATSQRLASPVDMPWKEGPVTSSPPPLPDTNDMGVDDPTLVQQEPKILSSNSKPVPASPHAESTAISGHVDHRHVDIAKEISIIQTAISDPFIHQHEPRKPNAFTRRLTGEGITTVPEHDEPTESNQVGHSRNNLSAYRVPTKPKTEEKVMQRKVSKTARTQMSGAQGQTDSIFGNLINERSQPMMHITDSSMQPQTSRQRNVVQYQEEANLEDDTLVENFQEEMSVSQGKSGIQYQEHADIGKRKRPFEDFRQDLSALRASSIRFDSQQAPSSFSSRSSTSAEPSSDPPIPSSEAEEMKWEEELKQHQRTLHDQLLSVSKRVLLHIVDSETVISDVAESFARNSEHMVQVLLEEQNGHLSELFEDLQEKKAALTKHFDGVARQLAKDRMVLC